jgi:hypothetical protein
MEGDSAKDQQRKDTFRALLQESIIKYAEIILAIDEMATMMKDDWKVKPDVDAPINFVSLSSIETTRAFPLPKLDLRTDGSVELHSMDEQKNEPAIASGQRKAKKRNNAVRLAPKLNNEKSIKEVFGLDGNWRIEMAGIRLFTGAAMETTQKLEGDFTMTAFAEVKVDSPSFYYIVIQAYGENFTIKATGNGHIRLERKGDKLGFQYGNQQPSVLVIKDANMNKPTTIRMYCALSRNYAGLSEIFIRSINIVGKTSNEELIP